MIINKEVREILDTTGNIINQLIVSYVNPDGDIQFLTYNIPQSEMFRWQEAKSNDFPNQYFKSWNGNPVKQVQTKTLSANRINEILLGLNRNNEINVIFENHSPKTAFCDIEVDVQDDGFPEAETAKNPVNTISWVVDHDVYLFSRKNLSSDDILSIQRDIDEYTESFNQHFDFHFMPYSNEADMLNEFMHNYFKPQPAITGWNFFNYDYMYLYNRCQNLSIDITYLSPTFKWKSYKHTYKTLNYTVNIPMHKLIYDYMEIYMKWDTFIDVKESNTLDFVSEQILGVKKVKHQLGFKEFWEKDPRGYMFYNAIDSILLYLIDQKIKTSQTFFSLAALTKVEVLDVLSAVSIITSVQTEYMFKENKVFPVTFGEQNKKEEYEGAYVFPVIPGIYKDIASFDFASLYPTTIRQFCISPDTFIKKDINYVPQSNEIKTVSGAIYKKEPNSLYPKMLTDFYKQRKVYKKEMKIATQEKYDLMDILEQRLKK